MTDKAVAATTPMTLDEACRDLLRGLVKASTLKAAIAAGRLSHERQGRRIIVTKRDIEEWREACRVEARRAPVSGSSPNEPIPVPDPSNAPSGASSTTEESSAALAAALASVERLKTVSRPTSRGRGSRTGPATVHRLR